MLAGKRGKLLKIHLTIYNTGRDKGNAYELLDLAIKRNLLQLANIKTKAVGDNEQGMEERELRIFVMYLYLKCY